MSYATCECPSAALLAESEGLPLSPDVLARIKRTCDRPCATWEERHRELYPEDCWTPPEPWGVPLVRVGCRRPYYPELPDLGGNFDHQNGTGPAAI